MSNVWGRTVSRHAISDDARRSPGELDVDSSSIVASIAASIVHVRETTSKDR
jgi:hypothetical protein